MERQRTRRSGQGRDDASGRGAGRPPPAAPQPAARPRGRTDTYCICQVFASYPTPAVHGWKTEPPPTQRARGLGREGGVAGRGAGGTRTLSQGVTSRRGAPAGAGAAGEHREWPAGAAAGAGGWGPLPCDFAVSSVFFFCSFFKKKNSYFLFMDRNTSVRAAGVCRVGAGTRAGMQLRAPRRGRRLQGKAPQVVEIRANQETGRFGAFFFSGFFFCIFFCLFLWFFVLFCFVGGAGRGGRAGFAMHASRGRREPGCALPRQAPCTAGGAARAGVSDLFRDEGLRPGPAGGRWGRRGGGGDTPPPALPGGKSGEARPGGGPRVRAPRP